MKTDEGLISGETPSLKQIAQKLDHAGIVWAVFAGAAAAVYGTSRPLTDVDGEMEARLTQHDIQGITVPVVPAEDNILLKASWGRGPEEGKHDWEDVEAMLSHLPALDWEYLRWRAENRGPRQRSDLILNRLFSLSNRGASGSVAREKR